MIKKIMLAILGTFLSIIAFMKLLTSLNEGNLILNTLAIAGIVSLVFLIIKTRLFTKLNFKTKNKNEENS